MKILYLNPSGNLGGAERSLLNMISSLRTAKPNWAVDLVAAGEGSVANEAHALGISTKVLPFPPLLARLGDATGGGTAPNGNHYTAATMTGLCRAIPGVATYAARLRRLIRDVAPDIIHTNGFKMHILGLWSRHRAVPVVWHVHDYVSSRPVMSRLIRAHSGRAAAAIANSRSVADDLRVSCGGQLKVFTIHNGVDLDHFFPAGPRLDLEALAGLGPARAGTIRVGLVATMARWKGHEVFLRALAMLPTDPPILGYIIGGPLYQTDGSQYSIEELRRSAARLRLEGRMGFTGFVQDPAAAIRSLDIVVHASTEPEPFGLVIAEAMACGKAVIASAAGGASEIISPGSDALTHVPGDACGLARRIRQLAADSRLRVRLGKAGRITAGRRFNYERLAKDVIPIYQTIMSSAA